MLTATSTIILKRKQTITVQEKKVKSEEIKNILIIRDDHLGDLICSLPTIVALRKHFSHSMITIVVSESCREIVENHPAIDSVLVRIKKKRGFFSKTINFWERIKLLHTIRKGKFDLVVALRSRFCTRHALMAAFSGAPLRLGHRSKKKKHVLLNGAFNIFPSHFNQEQHELMRTHDIVKEIDVPLNEVVFGLQTKPEHDYTVSEFLETRGIREDHLIICYHVSASKPKKQWPLENMVSLINLVQNNYPDIFNVLTYDPFNSRHKDFLEQNLSGEIAVFESKEFMQLASLYRKCDVLVSLDGAPMHLGAALGVPTLGIFEAENTMYWAPWGEKNASISGRGEINSLLPEEVFEKLDKLIKTHALNKTKKL